MKCDACRDNFTAYLEGDLTEAERAECDAHLASCPDCVAALREFEAAVSLLRALPKVEMPAGLADQITAAIKAEKLPELAPRRTRTWWEWASGLAAAAGLLIAVVLWNQGAFRTQPLQGLTQSPAITHDATPAPTAPDTGAIAAAPTGTEATPQGAAPAGTDKPASHATGERRAHGAPAARPRDESPIAGPPPAPPSESGGMPAPAPMPNRTSLDGGGANIATPAAAPAGATQAKSFEVTGPEGMGTPATKGMRGPSAMKAMAVAPVQGGVQLQVLPPANCIVGEPAWMSIGVTSDVQVHEAQVSVEPGTAVQLSGASSGVVYRGSLERGKTVRVPVEITVSRPGTARLRVVLHSEKPELNSPLYVTTPAFAPAPAGQTPRDASRIEVRLAFDETPLRDAFTLIGRETGVRVIPGEAVDKRPVTVDFGRGVPLPAALRILADVGDYQVLHSRDTYRIEAKQHPNHPH